MFVNLNKLNISEKIKVAAKCRGLHLTKLAEEFNHLYGTKYSASSFRNKLNNGALSYDDVEKIGAILGFSVEIKFED